MIKFFRKIRQKLLSENKFSKYLIYAIGEILLVVIGILIALQINNANEERKRRQTERSYLVRLVVDLEENKQLWSNLYESEESRLKASQAFINYSFNKDKDDIWTVMPYFNSVSNWDDLYINQVTFQEMVSSGNFDLISNEDIKFKLQNLEKLYQTISNHWNQSKKDLLQVLSNLIIEKVNFLYTYPLDEGQTGKLSKKFTKEEKAYYTNEIIKQYTVLFDDPLFMNLMTLIDTNTPLHLEEFKQADKQVNELIDLIKADLKTDN